MSNSAQRSFESIVRKVRHDLGTSHGWDDAQLVVVSALVILFGRDHHDADVAQIERLAQALARTSNHLGCPDYEREKGWLWRYLNRKFGYEQSGLILDLAEALQNWAIDGRLSRETILQLATATAERFDLARKQDETE